MPIMEVDWGKDFCIDYLWATWFKANPSTIRSEYTEEKIRGLFYFFSLKIYWEYWIVWQIGLIVNLQPFLFFFFLDLTSASLGMLQDQPAPSHQDSLIWTSLNSSTVSLKTIVGNDQAQQQSKTMV